MQCDQAKLVALNSYTLLLSDSTGVHASAKMRPVQHTLARRRQLTMRYTFGDYTLDRQRYELCRAGIPLQLQPKVFDLLAYLTRHRDRVVTRQELFDTLWPEQFVSEDALERIVVLARRAVGDSGRTQRLIKTIHGRGYRFVAPVEEHPPAPPGAALLPAPPHAYEGPAVLYPVEAERKQVTVLSCAISHVVMQA